MSSRTAGCGAALAALIALLAAVATASCGGADGSPEVGRRGTAAKPAICGPLRARIIGHVRDAAATELSGLVRSPDRPGVLWTHNDSGDRPRLLAIGADGTVLADVAVTSAAAIDWEDIAARGRRLFAADIGDNDRVRSTVDVYRVPEPAPGATSAPATRLALRYPDGAHDAETLLVDPRTGTLAVVTKELDGRSDVYTAPQRPGTLTTLRRVASLDLGIGGLATAGDVSADGRIIAVRTYGALFAWRRRGRESLAAALRRRPCASPTALGGEGQGESLALSRDGATVFTVPEGERPAVRRYAPRR